MQKSIPFTTQTRMSGVDIDEESYRKGASSAITEYVKSKGGNVPSELDKEVEQNSKIGRNSSCCMHDAQIPGVIHLRGYLKRRNTRTHLCSCGKWGSRLFMITGDNHLTAAAIAAEAGVDDFLSEAKPEDKLRLIRENQQHGHMVAMTGDGTNDCTRTGAGRCGCGMNTGTQPAAREAANIIDLDSNPTKLMDIVEIGESKY